MPRSAHETEIRKSAASDSLRHWVCSESQRPMRYFMTRRIPANFGTIETTTAASTPATMTIRNPARTVQERASVIAIDASGASAALSSMPRMMRLSPIVPSPARVPGYRFTQAMRIASSTRPGIATPPTQAAPPANASAPAVGRSFGANRRCQPHALKA